MNIQIDLRSSLTQKPGIEQPRRSLDPKIMARKCKETTKEENIKVFVRLKPLSEDDSDASEGSLVEQVNTSTLKVDSGYYSFDRVFSVEASQSTIFQ